MELLFILVLAGLGVLWISNRNLKQRIDGLEQRIGGPLPVPPEELPEAGAAPAWDSFGRPRPADPPAVTPDPEPEPEPEPEIEQPWLPEPPREGESLGGLFERLVAGRLLIWIGGAALAAAAVLLIRHSIEIGLVTPELRMIAAGLFGLLLLGAGEYARAGRLLSDDPRFAQALVGAGLIALYGTPYGSLVLYDLIGSGTAAVAMAAVSGVALFMSLRHGAPAAVTGLVGGILTPALVGSADSGALPLLGYLALLNLVVFAVAWRRGWGWLAAAAVLLSFGWTGYFLFRPPDDALAAGAFVVLLAVAAALLRPGGGALGAVQPLAIGIVQLAVLVARSDLGGAAWGLFALLGAASLALAALRPEMRPAPPLGAALALALLYAKATTGADPWVAPAAVGIAALFGGGALALRALQDRLTWTLTACAGFAGPALIVRSARPELLERPAWGGLMLALALAPAALVWLNRRRASAAVPADLALLGAGAAGALLLGSAVWDLLPAGLAAAGWLAAALPIAYAARRLGDLALGTVATATAAVAVARALYTLPELSIAGAGALLGFPPLAADLPTSLDALYALALPALLLAALRLTLPELPLGARRALPVIALLFAAAALYVWFKQAFGLAGREDFVARGLLERMLLTQMLFAAGWLFGAGVVRPPRLDPGLARLLGTMLTALAAARLIWFDLFLHNPASSDQWVGTWPVANLILAQFGLSALWLYLARRRADQATRSGFWLGAFLAALIAATALLVRQAFQGPILTGAEMPTAEFYAYSLAGLLLSVALLVAGMRLPDKALRLAGLVLLTATIVKVFLVDASELEGIWRILSFLGLGVALIGVGRLYGPVLRAEAKRG